VLSVSDNGAGIAPEVLPHLFDRYYRGTSATAGSRGTGLGLAIVKQIATAHGGEVGVTSAPGQGSTFIMRLRL
jgi:signal transduction histidine kinase